MKGKIIILSAPSGSGKSSIISKIIDRPDLRLGFSISATSRQPRGAERHGVEYYFLSPEEFAAKVDAGEFVEWEEVYAGTCYKFACIYFCGKLLRREEIILHTVTLSASRLPTRS